MVSGKAYKDSHGNIHMKKPQYIAKQLTFIIKRLKKKFKIIKTFFLFILIAHLVGLYYFGNWIYKKYLSNISIREVQDDEE